MEDPGSEEQGLIARRILHSFHRPIDGEFIRQLFLHRTPVIPAKCALPDLWLRAGPHLEVFFKRLMGGITPTGKNLARTTCAVAVLIKILWQGDRVGQVLAPRVVPVIVDPAGRRAQTGEGRGARGSASGCGAVGILK